jgi:hypothetical protein
MKPILLGCQRGAQITGVMFAITLSLVGLLLIAADAAEREHRKW